MGTQSEVAFLSRALKAPRIAALASPLADRARSEGWDYEHYLAQVLHEEVASRESHGGRRALGKDVSLGAQDRKRLLAHPCAARHC